MLAATWPPTAPPIVRMTAFMPVATPGLIGADGLDDEVRHGGEREADAGAEHERREVDLPVRRVGQGELEEGDRRQ